MANTHQDQADEATDKSLSTTQFPTDLFERSPSPEPPILPATTFKDPQNSERIVATLKRSLSLDPQETPQITSTRASSPDRLESATSKRSTTPDMEIGCRGENAAKKDEV
jgi:hypothetical protein